MSESELAGLLGQVRAFFADYVIVPGDEYLDAITLWIAHSHAIAAADTSPRLIFKSPEKESGKTRALEVLELLTPKPLAIINTTIAAIFRLVAQESPTILMDEVDAIFGPRAAREHEDLRALLNAGYRRGATVARVVGEGKKMKVERFPVFAATALAAIGDLPDTIESRSVIVPMKRRAPDEQVAAFRRRRALLPADELRGWLADWAEHHVDELEDAEPEMPTSISDRAADCWEALLAIADLAGGNWPVRARAAAVLIVSSRVSEDVSVGVRLLADIRTALGKETRITSADLLSKLNGLEESTWGGWHEGKGITARDLGRRLKPFGIVPKVIRIGEETPRGYELADFQDAFSRYLRDSSATSATKRNTDSNTKTSNVADVADVAHKGGGTSNDQTQIPLPGEAQQPQQAQHQIPNRVPTVAAVADNGYPNGHGELAAEQLDELYPDAVFER